MKSANNDFLISVAIETLLCTCFISLQFLYPSFENCLVILNPAELGMRLVFRLRRYDHVSNVLAIGLLHWLRLSERVNFKLALMHGIGIPSVERFGTTISEPSRFGI